MAEPSAEGEGQPPAGDPHHVLAASSMAGERTRVLKHGDTFAVFDPRGCMKPGGLGEEGLFHEGTRYLSTLILELDGQPPVFLGSTIRDENDQLSVTLTNPDWLRDGKVAFPLGSLHLAVRTFLWRGACHWQLRLRNFGPSPADARICLRLLADFTDIFEVRGMTRAARGRDGTPEVSADRVVLAYVGLDGQPRRTLLRFDPPPDRLTADRARFDWSVRPHEEFAVDLAVACWRGVGAEEPPGFAAAWADLEGASEQFKERTCRVRASDGKVDAWLRRAESDLQMLITDLPTGPYPYAGVPWFNTPFGRDGIITALQALWLRPEVARGVLGYLASTQAVAEIPEQDAEPGKILHETRNGEMAVLGEMPFGRYYGSVDATPLFVLLAGAYYQRTADLGFASALWPNVEAALGWLDRDGDRDGDGFVEYERRTAVGLAHQGWKDSDDALAHADGTPANGPIALCEVQAYVYAARLAAAVLARALGLPGRAEGLEAQAARLRERFEEAFWCEELGTYALALDGDKRPCRVRTSNAGHCLFGGIVSPDRAARVARSMMSPDLFSGWGIRTLASTEARYNPMAYHNGSVWPHDNSLIAYGAARYGMPELADRVLDGMFSAGAHFELNRMPELFCGFDREPGVGPIPYPVACAPQAWAAGSVSLLLQGCLGLEVSGVDRRVCFHRPQLPSSLPELRITNLSVAGATVDLLLVRHMGDVGVNVLHRVGEVSVLVEK